MMNTVFVTHKEGGQWFPMHIPETALLYLLERPHLTTLAAVRRGGVIFDFVIARNFPATSPWRFWSWLSEGKVFPYGTDIDLSQAP
jgi:uncharacterized membrane protein